MNQSDQEYYLLKLELNKLLKQKEIEDIEDRIDIAREKTSINNTEQRELDEFKTWIDENYVYIHGAYTPILDIIEKIEFDYFDSIYEIRRYVIKMIKSLGTYQYNANKIVNGKKGCFINMQEIK